MKYLTLIILTIIAMDVKTVIDFSRNTELENWRIVDDVVMDGRSSGNFELTPGGNGRFWGEVSLDNNGGFSSVRYNFSPLEVKPYTHLEMRVKGDGKKYQLRLKNDDDNRYTYGQAFETNGEWETIKISLGDLTPIFRGRTMNLPNFDHDHIEELGILIANKKPETFELLIDKIKLVREQ